MLGDEVGNFFLVFDIAVNFEGEDDGGVFRMEVSEALDGDDDVFEEDGGSGSVAVFDDGAIRAVVYIDFDTPESVFEIDEIPFDPAVAEKLSASEISVMGRVAVVVIERFVEVDGCVFVLVVEEVVVGTEDVVAEFVEREGFIDSGAVEELDDFLAVLFGFFLLLDQKSFELLRVQFGFQQLLNWVEFFVVVLLKHFDELVSAVKHFPEFWELRKVDWLYFLSADDFLDVFFHLIGQVDFHQSDQVFEFLPADFSALVGIGLDEGFEDGRVVGIVYFWEGAFYFGQVVFEAVPVGNVLEHQDPDILFVFEHKVCVKHQVHKFFFIFLFS